MKVYAVMEHIHYEDCAVTSIHATMDGAKAQLAKAKTGRNVWDIDKTSIRGSGYSIHIDEHEVLE